MIDLSSDKPRRTRFMNQKEKCTKCNKRIKVKDTVISRTSRQFKKIYHIQCALELNIITKSELEEINPQLEIITASKTYS